MTDIEILKKEIKEKQAQLKELESRQRDGKKLNFKKYRKFSEHGFDDVCFSDSFIAHLRNFVLMISSVHTGVPKPTGEKRLACTSRTIKVKDVSEKNLRICNSFIDELYPVVSKYVGIFWR